MYQILTPGQNGAWANPFAEEASKSSASWRELKNCSSSLAVACARRLVSSALSSFFATVTQGGDMRSLTSKNTMDDGVTIDSPITAPMLVSGKKIK